jgi:hypothetical protein
MNRSRALLVSVCLGAAALLVGCQTTGSTCKGDKDCCKQQTECKKAEPAKAEPAKPAPKAEAKPAAQKPAEPAKPAPAHK